MANFGDVITAIQQRTGYDGDDYLVQIKRAINWAKDEICSVNWKFLWRLNTSGITTAAGDVIYDLADDFRKLDSMYVNDAGATWTMLEESHEVDIMVEPYLTSGTPRFYGLVGYNATTGVEQTWIGSPTADDSYAVRYSYYRKVDDLTDTAASCVIQTVYRDTPLISGGLWKFHKDLDEHDLAKDAMEEFVFDMASMESEKPFNGPSYKEILAQRKAD